MKIKERIKKRVSELEEDLDQTQYLNLDYPLVTQSEKIKYAIKVLKEVIDGD